jgi:hypothetical protein
MQGYPTWRYHKSKEPKLVHSEAELKALGPDWDHSPACFEEKPMAMKPVPKEAQPAKVAEAPSYKEHQETWESKEEKGEAPAKVAKPKAPKAPKVPKASKKKSVEPQLNA